MSRQTMVQTLSRNDVIFRKQAQGSTGSKPPPPFEPKHPYINFDTSSRLLLLLRSPDRTRGKHAPRKSEQKSYNMDGIRNVSTKVLVVGRLPSLHPPHAFLSGTAPARGRTATCAFRHLVSWPPGFSFAHSTLHDSPGTLSLRLLSSEGWGQAGNPCRGPWEEGPYRGPCRG